MKKTFQKIKNRGFTIFFAVLVSSLALSIGIAIYDLVVRELQVSSITEQSQYAIYAADTGTECAFYWDTHYNCQNINGANICNSVFASSTTDTIAAGAVGSPSILCAGSPIMLSSDFKVSKDPVSGTTMTTFQVPTGVVGRTYFDILYVSKSIDGTTGNTDTAVYSYGYNTPATTSPSAVERELQANY